MTRTRCVRHGCGHPKDEHTGADGCTRLVPGEFSPSEKCFCNSFLSSRETMAAHEDLLGSDGASNAPEANDSPLSASTPRIITPETSQRIVRDRVRMSNTRPAKTRAFTLRQTSPEGKVEKVKLYFTVGFFESGDVGEIFIKADRQGAQLSGALDAVGIFASMLLQYGASLSEVVGKIRGMNFPPYGLTGVQDIPTCSSPLDLLARWLQTFLPKE